MGRGTHLLELLELVELASFVEEGEHARALLLGGQTLFGHRVWGGWEVGGLAARE